MTEKENRRPMGEKRRSANGYSFSKRRAVGSTQTTPTRICMRPIDELCKEYEVQMPRNAADELDLWSEPPSSSTPSAMDQQKTIRTSFPTTGKHHECIKSPISTESQASGHTVNSCKTTESEEQRKNISLGDAADDPSRRTNETVTETVDRKPVGLANIGNSCFINAVLRALLSLKRVRDEINQPSLEATGSTTDESLERNLCKVYEYTEQKSAKEFNLRQVIRGIWKSSSLEQFRQHDAHEFLLALFERLPFADKCFGIPLQIQVQCTSCRQLRVRYDRTLDLSASPHGDDETNKLTDCLRRTFGPELVADVPCDQCKNCHASVVRRIMALPLLLVLCLMRFDYRQKTDDQGAVKLNDSVAIPAEINLEPFCLRPSMPARYELRAVVSHCGYSVEYGHYVCDAVASCSRQNGAAAADEQWFSFNDRDVERKELNAVLQQRQRTAYLLFYQKIDT